MAEGDARGRLMDIAQRAKAAVGADRCTIFEVDSERNELFSRVALGLAESEEIRLPKSRGAIGFVARTGRSLRLRDAYNDPRFDPSTDQRTGYRTKSILCVPIGGSGGAVIGAIEAINKLNGVFSDDDEQQLRTLCEEAAGVITPPA